MSEPRQPASDSAADPPGRPSGSPDDTPSQPVSAAAEREPLVGWLPRSVTELFGPEATATHSYDLLTVDVPAGGWIAALNTARTTLGCTYFDWLSAVDEPGVGFWVCAHVVALRTATAGPTDTELTTVDAGVTTDTDGADATAEAGVAAECGTSAGGGASTRDRGGPSGLSRLLLRTRVEHEAAELPTATGVYAGAAWHERETHEMFGVTFTDHPGLTPLLLPDRFEGHPLRKDFVLAARVAKAWPGAKEPGESSHGGPRRRQMLPPGVPDPNEWGPLKGQLPATPGRSAGRGARGTADQERPARRTRGASAGSASQRATGEAPERPARRNRSASAGSASQRAPGDRGVSAGDPPASADSTTPGGGTDGDRGVAAPHTGRTTRGHRGRGGDAPWHQPETSARTNSGGPAGSGSAADSGDAEPGAGSGATTGSDPTGSAGAGSASGATGSATTDSATTDSELPAGSDGHTEAAGSDEPGESDGSGGDDRERRRTGGDA